MIRDEGGNGNSRKYNLESVILFRESEGEREWEEVEQKDGLLTITFR